MTLNEVKKLFIILINTYPNFTQNEAKAAIWHDLLKDIPFERAQRNLRAYIMDGNNKYPPHPGELAKTQSGEAQGRYVPNAAETRVMLEKLAEPREIAPLPPAVLELKARLKSYAGKQQYD